MSTARHKYRGYAFEKKFTPLLGPELPEIGHASKMVVCFTACFTSLIFQQ